MEQLDITSSTLVSCNIFTSPTWSLSFQCDAWVRSSDPLSIYSLEGFVLFKGLGGYYFVDYTLDHSTIYMCACLRAFVHK